MGADRHEKRAKNRLPPFVPLLVDTLNSPAWRAMSHGAKVLYVALRRRYSPNYHNNGRIFLSQRDAAKELRSHHNEIARWFRELQHYGFIVMVTPGVLGLDGKGKAPRWRLTELGYMKEFPTRDFMTWDGRRFQDSKTKSRAGKPAQSVPENSHTNVPKSRTSKGQSVPELARISAVPGEQEIPHRTSLPYATTAAPTAAVPTLDHAGSPPLPSVARPTRPKRVRPRLHLDLDQAD